MKIVSIEWRNIGSFGDKIQKIEFKNDGCLWQLYGRSGYGKSTILSLPALAFYGKIPKVKIGNIANRINKNGWIRCVVINGTDKFEIERTFSPNSLKLKRNEEVIDKANSKELENIIENEIVSMPYQIFSNVISLSLNNFKSFIDTQLLQSSVGICGGGDRGTGVCQCVLPFFGSCICLLCLFQLRQVSLRSRIAQRIPVVFQSQQDEQRSFTS